VPVDAAKKGAAAKPAKPVFNATAGEMLRTPVFYVLWASFFIGAGAGLMVIGSVAGIAKKSMGPMAFVAVAIMAIGNAGGRLTMEHPEFQAMEIKRFEPAPAAEAKGLYCFPTGTLLWCGLVNETTRATTDLTSRAGLVRRRSLSLRRSLLVAPGTRDRIRLAPRARDRSFPARPG
jgi:hypothetical protein